jgi:deazaflavin-dependent oxidoreductase (nitroreductase family)
MNYLDIADHLWPVLGPLMRGHAAIYRATGGWIGGSIPGVPPLLLLDHVGARSGQHRTTPLVYMPDGDRQVVVASKGGHPRDPGWLHNLRAHPETTVQIGRETRTVCAREASAEERRGLWPKAVRFNPLWGRYQERTTRQIPVVVLEPR